MNFTGGNASEFIVRDGGELNITGGLFGEISDEGELFGGEITLLS